jgi:hypothetical protein
MMMARNPVQSMMADCVVEFRLAKANAVPVTR